MKVVPRREWFQSPNLKEPTPLTFTDEGRIYGHLATFGVCHTGEGRACLQAPRSKSGYSFFRTGAVYFPDDQDPIPTGPITMSAGHAALNLDARRTIEHYDNSATAIGDVAAGEDNVGIWIAGAVRPGTTKEQLYAARASAPSGDWRSIQGRGLELVACLLVNHPGFLNARALRAAGAPEDCDECIMSLTAAGALRREVPAIRAADVRPGDVLVHAGVPRTVSSVTFAEDGKVRIEFADRPEAVNVRVIEELGGPGSGPHKGAKMSYVDHAGDLHTGGTYAGKFGKQHGVKFDDGSTHLVDKSQLRPDAKFSTVTELADKSDTAVDKDVAKLKKDQAKDEAGEPPDTNDAAVDNDIAKTEADQAKDEAEELAARIGGLERALFAITERVYAMKEAE